MPSQIPLLRRPHRAKYTFLPRFVTPALFPWRLMLLQHTGRLRALGHPSNLSSRTTACILESQTLEGERIMKVLTSCLMGSLLFLANQISVADEIINLHCRSLTEAEFTAIGEHVFTSRRYSIANYSGDTVMGKLKNRKVVISLASPDQIVIRWLPGFSGRNQWLRNLKTDILWKLAE